MWVFLEQFHPLPPLPERARAPARALRITQNNPTHLEEVDFKAPYAINHHVGLVKPTLSRRFDIPACLARLTPAFYLQRPRRRSASLLQTHRPQRGIRRGEEEEAFLHTRGVEKKKIQSPSPQGGGAGAPKGRSFPATPPRGSS